MKKFENFCRALENLKTITTVPEPYDVVTLTGCVGLFKICFDQAWKATKETLARHGYAESETGSPRMILKLAYKATMIDDERNWLDALNARNNVARSYNEEIALSIVERAKARYLGLFEDLKRTLEENWL